MIVTLDGPAGAGKSSVARALAERLGFRFLDTGAMYRAVAWAAIDRGVPLDDAAALATLARSLTFTMSDEQVLVDGQDVTAAIRQSEITEATQYPAGNPAVRSHLVTLQRALGSSSDIVTEGRDQGTIVFPQAECKIYLNASPLERARRRQQDLAARGEAISVETILDQQNSRDERDTSRAVGALRAADDAIEVMTDGLSTTEVIDRLETLVRKRIAALPAS